MKVLGDDSAGNRHNVYQVLIRKLAVDAGASWSLTDPQLLRPLIKTKLRLLSFFLAAPSRSFTTRHLFLAPATAS